ncbi:MULTISPECIES: RNase adapter RapZ [Corynebacterium]|uniref:RapZ C-terminal domain-containing protein n=1 Tax=unclassified Corynebacterium TaxID=2624378 RepID=UPI00178C62DF|nr:MULTISPECIES: RNase adapter RapZ [Corynebacterium]
MPATLRYDASQLPNPHDEPALRPRDGRSPQVQQWLCDHDDFARVLAALTRRAHAAAKNTAAKNTDVTIAIACSAGKHRSVALAELLAASLAEKGHEVAVEHSALNTHQKRQGKTAAASSKSTKQRGYDHRHKRTRKALLATMTQGQPCWWCGKPMYREPERNPDGRPLAADHINAGGAARHETAGRLLHFTCNSQRQDGTNDNTRPALGIQPNREPNTTPAPAFRWK